MNLNCLNNQKGPENWNERIHKKYERPTHVSQMPGVGDVADWMTKVTDTGELPEWAKKDRNRVKLREDVEKRRRDKETPGKKGPGGKEVKEEMEIRFQKEIFKTIENQRWYMERVKEALEKLTGDRLHDFIKAHQKYGRENYVQWNTEYAQLLGLNIPKEREGGSRQMMHKRITAATQHVLVNYYNNDVFQLYEAKPITWAQCDGKMGPYTTSVLGDYWNSVHGPTSDKPDFGRSGLDDSIPEDSPRRKSYAVAMAFLTEKLAESIRDEETPEEDKEPSEALGDKVKEEREARQNYRTLDESGEEVKMSDLYIKHHEAKKNHISLLTALAEAYGEDPKNPGKSKKTFRAMHLLSVEEGGVDRMKVDKGELIKVSRNGLLTVLRKDNSVRHQIKMKKPVA